MTQLNVTETGNQLAQKSNPVNTNEKKESRASSSNPSNNNKTQTESSNKNQHTHNWVEQTKVVYHEASGHYDKVLVTAAWTEEIPVFETVAIEVCNTCGADMTDNVRQHVKAHAIAGEGGSCRTEYIQKQTGTQTVDHPAEYKEQWKEDKAAWCETVVTGYKCSCGATK